MSDLGVDPEFRAWMRKRDLWFAVFFAGGVMIFVGAFPFSHTFDWMLYPGYTLVALGGFALDRTKAPPG